MALFWWLWRSMVVFCFLVLLVFCQSCFTFIGGVVVVLCWWCFSGDVSEEQEACQNAKRHLKRILTGTRSKPSAYRQEQDAY